MAHLNENETDLARIKVLCAYHNAKVLHDGMCEHFKNLGVYEIRGEATFTKIYSNKLVDQLSGIKTLTSEYSYLREYLSGIKPDMYEGKLEKLYNRTALWIEYRRNLNLVRWGLDNQSQISPTEASCAREASELVKAVARSLSPPVAFGGLNPKLWRHWQPKDHDKMVALNEQLQPVVDHFMWLDSPKVQDIFETAKNQLQWAYNLWLPEVHELNKKFQKRIDEDGYLTEAQMADKIGGVVDGQEVKIAEPITDKNFGHTVTSFIVFMRSRVSTVIETRLAAHKNKVHYGENASPYVRGYKRVEDAVEYHRNADEKYQEMVNKNTDSTVNILKSPLRDWGVRSYQMVYPLYQYLLNPTDK